MLKIVATTIKSIFAGDVEWFLAQKIIVYGNIRDLLEQQFNRLSTLEQIILFNLTSDRKVTLEQLQTNISPQISSPQLIEALESLKRRSLIQASFSGFTLQPVVREYVCLSKSKT
ncbi:MAG: hypothetical protein Tsb0014_20020 [Pleurocapsa sp.]